MISEKNIMTFVMENFLVKNKEQGKMHIYGVESYFL